MAGTLKNFYETLGVSRSATDEQIKTAYRKLILKFHPDKNIGDAYFEDWSKKIIEAFEVLSDPQLRAEYDQVYDEHKQAARKKYQEATVRQEPEPTPSQPAETEVPEPPVMEETEEEAPEATADTGKAPEAPTAADPAGAELAGINEQLPAYIAAKQEYLKAERDRKRLGRPRPAAKKNFSVLLIIICLALIAGSVVWIVKYPEKEKVEALPEGTLTSITGEYIVVADRAYVYKDPQNQVKTSDFLTKGIKVHVSKKYEDFYYVIFQSKANADYKLAGWVKEGDLQPYNE